MTILCINCAKADLERTRVRLSGEIRKHPYIVEMEGLKCPNCGYSTVDSKSMAELGRLAADEYRRAHGLLTSEDIVALRRKLDMSQEEFALFVGVGSASVKRWELGKIQDQHNNDLIIEKTTRKPQDIYEYCFTGSASTGSASTTQGFVLESATWVPDSVTLGPDQKLYTDELATKYRCPNCRQTAERMGAINKPAGTVSPFLAHLFIARDNA